MNIKKEVETFSKSVRLPMELKKEIDKLAQQNRRSLNAQIVYMLEQQLLTKE